MANGFNAIKAAFRTGQADEAATLAALLRYKMDGRHTMPEVTAKALVRQWRSARRPLA